MPLYLMQNWLAPEQIVARNLWKNTVIELQFEIPVPLKAGVEALPNDRLLAQNRFKTFKKKQ